VARAKRKRRNFIEYRQQYLSDRTWFGWAFVAIGLGNLGGSQGWVRLLMVLVGVAGALLVWSGVRRALGRTDPVTGAPRPAPPW
jgi:hypothetical protein